MSKKPRNPAKVMHDIVSRTSTILSINQMAQFMEENLSETMQDKVSEMIDTCHEVVEYMETVGEFWEDRSQTLDPSQITQRADKIAAIVNSSLANEAPGTMSDDYRNDLGRVVEASQEMKELTDELVTMWEAA